MQPSENTSQNTDNNLPAVDENIQDQAAINYIDSVCDDKQVKLYLLQAFGKTTKDAAKILGYSISYAYNLSLKMRNDPKWLDKLKPYADKIAEDYKTRHKIALPSIWEVKLGALNKMRSNPELAIRHPKLLRDMEENAGVIRPEGAPQQTINVDKIQVLVNNTLGNETQPPDNSETPDTIDIPKSLES